MHCIEVEPTFLTARMLELKKKLIVTLLLALLDQLWWRRWLTMQDSHRASEWANQWRPFVNISCGELRNGLDWFVLNASSHLRLDKRMNGWMFVGSVDWVYAINCMTHVINIAIREAGRPVVIMSCCRCCIVGFEWIKGVRSSSVGFWG